MKLPIRVLFFLVSTAAVLSLNGCTKKDREQIPAESVADNKTVVEVISVEKRAGKAPNFSWKNKSGEIMNLDSLRGKIVFLNFWATWCGPCKSELPDLVELSKRFADRNVIFIGASMDRGPNVIEDVRSFVQEEKLPYQNVLANDDLADAYDNVRLLPTSFLINADGKITQTFVGIRSKEYYSTAIASLLK